MCVDILLYPHAWHAEDIVQSIVEGEEWEEAQWGEGRWEVGGGEGDKGGEGKMQDKGGM